MVPTSKEVLAAALAAARAAVAYDDSLYGCAARGEHYTNELGVEASTSDELDELYDDWQKKARVAIELEARRLAHGQD